MFVLVATFLAICSSLLSDVSRAHTRRVHVPLSLSQVDGLHDKASPYSLEETKRRILHLHGSLHVSTPSSSFVLVHSQVSLIEPTRLLIFQLVHCKNGHVVPRDDFQEILTEVRPLLSPRLENPPSSIRTHASRFLLVSRRSSTQAGNSSPRKPSRPELNHGRIQMEMLIFRESRMTRSRSQRARSATRL